LQDWIIHITCSISLVDLPFILLHLGYREFLNLLHLASDIFVHVYLAIDLKIPPTLEHQEQMHVQRLLHLILF
jgi:hypothetical protein